MAEFRSVYSYQTFALRVTRSSRYIRDPEIEDFLSVLLFTSAHRKETIPKGKALYRAQIGHDWEPLYQEEDVGDISAPFSPERMKPLIDRAREGRANPKGIPYLYGANRKDTALAEVRPWIGSLISLGVFEIKKDLTIINTTTENHPLHIYFEEPEPQEREKVVWEDIDRAFSKPVSPNDEVADYVPTQIIAELFKYNGLEGIVYTSALGTGSNIVLFDLDSANLVSCSLYEVKDIEFNFKQASNTYSVVKRKEGKSGDAIITQ